MVDKRLEDLVNAVEQMEKEREEYLKKSDKQLEEMREMIRYMKENASDMTKKRAFILERAKKRLGEVVISSVPEKKMKSTILDVQDIPEDIIDEFYEMTDRTLNRDRVVLGFPFEVYDMLAGAGTGFASLFENPKHWGRTYHYWFFFTDTDIYIWKEKGSSWSRYPYMCFKNMKAADHYTSFKCDRTSEEHGLDIKEVTSGTFSISHPDFKIQLMRLILDLQDYKEPTDETPEQPVQRRTVSLPEDDGHYGDDPDARDDGFV